MLEQALKPAPYLLGGEMRPRSTCMPRCCIALGAGARVGRRALSPSRIRACIDRAGRNRRPVSGSATSGADVMPRRTDIESILIIGAGPIIIGQACEFDYSGAQACKALREEGYRVILVNSNPATIDDRSGDGRRDLHRADHLADGRQDHRARSVLTRCCRRWAARPRSTARSTWRAKAC